jgi:hypothetical protein
MLNKLLIYYIVYGIMKRKNSFMCSTDAFIVNIFDPKLAKLMDMECTSIERRLYLIIFR